MPAQPPPPAAAPPPPSEEEPLPSAGEPAFGPPPYRIALVADAVPYASALMAMLRANLDRGGAFVLDGARPAATLRVGSHGATLYLPAGVPGGPFERSFPVAGHAAAAARARALASDLHRFYLGEPGPYQTRIAFVAGTSTNPQGRHIFTLNFDGTDVRRVSGTEGPNLLPAWSSAGDVIYTGYVGGGPVLLLRPAGWGHAQLLGVGRDLNTGAAFSPDGQTIAVSQGVNGNTDIYLLDRQGRVRRRLTNHPGIDISPSWSPTGEELAFVSDRGGSPQVYRVSLRDGLAHRLTKSGFYNQEPAWCPRHGSRQIAYTHRYSGSRYEVHLLDADTGESSRLTFDGGQNIGPSWSPDCRLLVYSAGRLGLWVISGDGRHRRQLYNGRARSPAWSPVLPSQTM